jgi:hypothetical protein
MDYGFLCSLSRLIRKNCSSRKSRELKIREQIKIQKSVRTAVLENPFFLLFDFQSPQIKLAAGIDCHNKLAKIVVISNLDNKEVHHHYHLSKNSKIINWLLE